MCESPLISIVTPCFNEQDNVRELYQRLQVVFEKLRLDYRFEIVFIDNCSTDDTVRIIKEIASQDHRVKLIVNVRNFGHIRSPYYGLLQSRGDATIYLASDLQDPPELIPDFIEQWRAGFKLVMAFKPASQENKIIFWLRRMYYRLLDSISDVNIIKDSTGFGLYDRQVIGHLKSIEDPYPFLRGLICELGYEVKTIPFDQPRRLRGISKNNFYTLYDIAMLGIVSHSKIPIRLASFVGFLFGTISILLAGVFFSLKLLFWGSFPMGVAPIVIGMFFMFGVLMIFIGILGEYISLIHSYVHKRPIVVERERVNFDE